MKVACEQCQQPIDCTNVPSGQSMLCPRCRAPFVVPPRPPASTAPSAQAKPKPVVAKPLPAAGVKPARASGTSARPAPVAGPPSAPQNAPPVPNAAPPSAGPWNTGPINSAPINAPMNAPVNPAPFTVQTSAPLPSPPGTRGRGKKSNPLPVLIGAGVAGFLLLCGLALWGLAEYQRLNPNKTNSTMVVQTDHLGDEEAENVVTLLALTEAFEWLGDINGAELDGEPTITRQKARGRYYRVTGKLKGRFQKQPLAQHDYVVELSLSDKAPNGWSCHLVTISGTQCMSNPWKGKGS